MSNEGNTISEKNPVQEVDKELVARRLYEVMYDRGYSQKQLCEEINLTQSAYSRYTNGTYLPNPAQLYKISNALNISSDYLLGLERDIPSLLHEILNIATFDNSAASKKIVPLVEEILSYYSGASF